ncbi:MAG: sodium ion-translocating decarboxylase subunit beta [Spirochaetales bacterium]|nr:sodium ion-translocating decarboxylase subunit beta [Spirochaetales bacterium]
MPDMLSRFFQSTAFVAFQWQHAVMIAVGVLMLYLAIVRKYEPLLLVPIGFSAILVNLPLTGLLAEGGLFHYFYFGIQASIFPPLIFMGIGAMTDFGPLLSQPRTFLLGAAAQFGIFGTLLGARAFGFTFAEAAAIANIGGANGPTAIYLGSQLADHLLGPIAVAAYSYMALVPVIQPPIIKLLTTRKERQVVMKDVGTVSHRVKIIFPIATTIIAALIVPKATPLIGMFMLGNLFRESGVVSRLSDTAQNELLNIVTILLAISVGSKMSAEEFLTLNTLLIIGLGLVAFSIGTAGGVLLGKLMYVLSKGKINPMIGAAGVAAVPMSARVVQKLGQEENPNNFLLMNAMGPNVAGTIGSAIAAGVLLALAG